MAGFRWKRSVASRLVTFFPLLFFFFLLFIYLLIYLSIYLFVYSFLSISLFFLCMVGFIFFSNNFRVSKPALQLGRKRGMSRRCKGEEEQLLSRSFSVIKSANLGPQLVSLQLHFKKQVCHVKTVMAHRILWRQQK